MTKNGGQPEINGLRTWLTVDTEAARHNYQTLRARLEPKTLFMAVVKSNAYGHGLVEFSKLAARLGADWLGVDSILEAVALREEGVTAPILVLGYTLPEKFSEAERHHISLTISSLEHLPPSAGRNFKFHLKIDTGMRRQGFFPSDTPQLLRWLRDHDIAPEQVEGLYTHFAAAKNPAFPKETLGQFAGFQKVSEQFSNAGFKPLRHAAATGGALLFPETQLDLVRVGIGLYGLWPSPETKAALQSQLTLRPVLGWRTIIGETKNLPAGDRIGYDLTESLPRDGRVAICPIGYWHGYPRALSSIGPVIVGGERSKILGRVSMDMVAIDVSHVPAAKVGDEVTLLGRDGEEIITADDLANLSQTTSYEIITRLNPLMKRIFI